MSQRYNPYYNPEKLGLTMNEFNESGMCYEYNTLCFFLTGDGRIYSAQDSGCSCPIPFDGYKAETMEECVRQMSRIGSPEQAMSELSSWNDHNSYNQQNINELGEWIKNNLKA